MRVLRMLHFILHLLSIYRSRERHLKNRLLCSEGLTATRRYRPAAHPIRSVSRVCSPTAFAISRRFCLVVHSFVFLPLLSISKWKLYISAYALQIRNSMRHIGRISVNSILKISKQGRIARPHVDIVRLSVIPIFQVRIGSEKCAIEYINENEKTNRGMVTGWNEEK